MGPIKDYPLLVFAITLLVLWLSELAGAYILKRRAAAAEVREDVNIIQGAILTLLGLLIGFSFAMAVSRYDLRKTYEEAEANAIGTEYVRAGLLPAAERDAARALLHQYLDKRLQFYTARDAGRLQAIDTETAALQQQMWAVVERSAVAQPNVIVAMAAAGMNDVLNSEGYTQSAWWNRIPRAAWVLMLLVAVCCNVMVGYGVRKAEAEPMLMAVLPLVVATSFMLIADIDSPRGGLIRVDPHNLLRLAVSLQVR
ncbi:bestrophin-like domain [Cupriavidus campinensis]